MFDESSPITPPNNSISKADRIPPPSSTELTQRKDKLPRILRKSLNELEKIADHRVLQVYGSDRWRSLTFGESDQSSVFALGRGSE